MTEDQPYIAARERFEAYLTRNRANMTDNKPMDAKRLKELELNNLRRLLTELSISVEALQHYSTLFSGLGTALKDVRNPFGLPWVPKEGDEVKVTLRDGKVEKVAFADKVSPTGRLTSNDPRPHGGRPFSVIDPRALIHTDYIIQVINEIIYKAVLSFADANPYIKVLEITALTDGTLATAILDKLLEIKVAKKFEERGQ